MAEENEENTTGTDGSAANNMVRLLYLEIIRKDDYMQWKKDPQLCPQQPRDSTTTIEDTITPEVIQERFDISHLSVHLAAWEKQLPNDVQPIFSFSDVKAMTENSAKRTFQYELDGLTWSCEYFVKTWVSKAGNLMKVLSIHLPNEGFFYVNEASVDEFVGKTKKKGQKNSRHKNTCYEDWAVIEKTIWNKLKPFETFMAKWCGDDYDQRRVEKTVLYHSGSASRVDICMRMDHISIEFSFEHCFPVALEDDFWD